MASVYFLLFCDILLPGIFGVTEWGFKRYIKYEPGDMNLIITAPHGGRLNPSIQSNGHNWPYRANGCKGSDGKCIWKHNCGLTSTKCIALIKNDVCTLKIARDIADEIKAITGFRPHVVYNMIRRSKLDANREINEATFNVPDAIMAYHNYTDFINKARTSITGRGLLLDIHGSADNLQRTLLGYLLYSNYVDKGDYNMEMTSIKSLGEHWCGNDTACFKEFINGNRSLGYFMNHEGLHAVPSPRNKKIKPAVGLYLSGGYTVMKFGSRDGGNIDGIQMEFARALRSCWKNNVKKRVARAILSFYNLNYLGVF